jgi:hypothetical protein
LLLGVVVVVTAQVSLNFLVVVLEDIEQPQDLL